MTPTAPVPSKLPDYLRSAAGQALESGDTDAALELLQMLKRHQSMQNDTKLMVATETVYGSKAGNASAVKLLNATSDARPIGNGLRSNSNAIAAHSVAYWESYVMTEFRLDMRQIRGEYSFTVYELQKHIIEQFDGSSHGYYLTQGDTAILACSRTRWKDRLTEALLALKHAGKLSAMPRCKTYQFCD